MHAQTRRAQRGVSTGNAILLVFLGLLLIAGTTLVGAYNRLMGLDEAATAQWSEVINQYQRRSDLIPNLVEVTKQYAKHEEKVFSDIANARSKLGSLQVNANDPAALKQFQAAQGELGSALSRLMAVSENYPQLKANELFQNLQTQLEGTENRITTARNRYIEQVQRYNTARRVFPGNLVAGWAGLEARANFSVENEAQISTAPKVNFGS